MHGKASRHQPVDTHPHLRPEVAVAALAPQGRAAAGVFARLLLLLPYGLPRNHDQGRRSLAIPPPRTLSGICRRKTLSLRRARGTAINFLRSYKQIDRRSLMRRTTCSVVIRRVPAALFLFVVGEDIRPARQGQVNDAVHCLHHLANTYTPRQETNFSSPSMQYFSRPPAAVC